MLGYVGTLSPYLIHCRRSNIACDALNKSVVKEDPEISAGEVKTWLVCKEVKIAANAHSERALIKDSRIENSEVNQLFVAKLPFEARRALFSGLYAVPQLAAQLEQISWERCVHVLDARGSEQ